MGLGDGSLQRENWGAALKAKTYSCHVGSGSVGMLTRLLADVEPEYKKGVMTRNCNRWVPKDRTGVLSRWHEVQ